MDSTSRVFTNRADLDTYLNEELMYADSYKIYTVVQVTRSFRSMLPQWNRTDRAPQDSDVYRLYDNVLETTVKYQMAQSEKHEYSTSVHSSILDTLVAIQGFIPVMEYLRYKFSVHSEEPTDPEYPTLVDILGEDIDGLLNRHPTKVSSYQAYLKL